MELPISWGREAPEVGIRIVRVNGGEDTTVVLVSISLIMHTFDSKKWDSILLSKVTGGRDERYRD